MILTALAAGGGIFQTVTGGIKAAADAKVAARDAKLEVGYNQTRMRAVLIGLGIGAAAAVVMRVVAD
jgi:tetrahydromethanopterin S-methyltransferase subunit F